MSPLSRLMLRNAAATLVFLALVMVAASDLSERSKFWTAACLVAVGLGLLPLVGSFRYVWRRLTGGSAE
jgi:hypothetical protein